MHTIVCNYGLRLVVYCVPYTVYCVGHCSDTLSISSNLRDKDPVYSILIILYSLLCTHYSFFFTVYSSFYIHYSFTNKSINTQHIGVPAQENLSTTKEKIILIKYVRFVHLIIYMWGSLCIEIQVYRKEQKQDRTRFILILSQCVLFYLNK